MAQIAGTSFIVPIALTTPGRIAVANAVDTTLLSSSVSIPTALSTVVTVDSIGQVVWLDRQQKENNRQSWS